MPRPVYPDDRLAACLFCSQVFLVRPDPQAAGGPSALERHEEGCALRPPVPTAYFPLNATGTTFTGVVSTMSG